jgi:adenylate cyclase class 1
MDLDIKNTKKRFLAINRERLRRTQNALRWKQRDFLELLPIFFHINHAMLPGYVSKNTPAGIPQYNPSKKGLDGIKKIAKSFTYKRRALRTYDIHSIFIMGSVGTIAHSEKSDFDIWICHTPELTEMQLSELRAKCVAIEQWAETIGLEVHFFPMNADEFRMGGVHELSSESSGSTQHHLLLEEFYRTSLLVAGRYPVWWLVPPEEEKNYDDFVHNLLHKRFIPRNEVIDFGGLSQIPAEEFFGAALWQVYKGIDSPYKSVLKILLMESYASAYPDIELLSLQYKKMVYSGVVDLTQLDPYFILLKKLEDFLYQQNETDRLDLVRRCFYFKVGLPLSQHDSKHDNWRYDVLSELVARWGWNKESIETLDDRGDWKIHKVLHERKILVDELTHSYLFLSKFARENTSLSRINQKDLNVLGRKLYAAFERKAGKIEMVNRGVSANVVERKLVLQQSISRDAEEYWNLLNEEETSSKQSELKHIKRSHSATELLAWCHFNRLMNPGTVITLEVRDSILNIKEVKSIIEALDHAFPNGNIPATEIDHFVQAPSIIGGGIFVNVGLDPLPAHSRRGTDIVSDKTDILSYSGFSFNLALSFDMIIVTSWQEILTYRYTGVNGLMECLCQYLRWHRYSKKPAEFELPAYSFSSSHSASIASRIQQLCNDVASAFYPKGKLTNARYILEVQKLFYVLTMENDNFIFERADSLRDLDQLLSQPLQGFIPIHVDRFTLGNTALSVIFPKNRPGKVQLFYEKHGSLAHVYVLDENGAVFHQTMAWHDDHALLNQYILFFDSVMHRQSANLQNDSAVELLDNIEYIKVNKMHSGKYKFERKYIKERNLRRRYFHVQVIGNMVDNITEFTVYCEGKEFSSFDYGKSLFREVARHVYDRRESGIKYPIYITDLDLAPLLLGNRDSGPVQLIDYLNYKKRIEEKLNKELASL